ncbi:MAG: hypothetical protein VX938_07705, partial [Myxococcota bacterium]|nr:hypothetical protein [Myxococcota bacterium]
GGIFQTLEPAGLAPGELTCTVTPGDGADEGAAVTSAPSLLVNHPPAITGVTLGPDPATEASTLTCTPSGWSDEDGDPPDYLFAWSVQGEVLDGADEQTLTGDHFDKGQLVLCIVTPTDGSEEGGTHTSNPIQIDNSPPSLSGAEVSPPTGGKGTTFTCQVNGHGDADEGDPELTTYTWLIGDEPIDGAIESTVVPGDSGYHGAQLRCQATPFDGTDYGDPVVSGTATLINGAPMVSGVTIVPQAPTALDALSCVANLAIDPEGDTITFGVVWTRNQSPLPEQTNELLSADQHQEGDVIRCQLTPDDGELTGPGVWSEEVVIGPAPALDPPEVTLLPANPSPGEALFCDVAEPDGDVTYTWFLEGEEVQEATEDTLSGALVEACESWTCRATVTGPDGVSPPGEDTVTVGPATGEGDIVWHGHHGYTLGGAPPVGVSQWYQNEKVATLLELPDGVFPLTVTHVRFYGAVGSGYNVRVYDTQGILPADTLDGGLGGASGVGIGGLTTLELDEPVTFETPQDFYLSLQGQTDLQPLYGDG